MTTFTKREILDLEDAQKGSGVQYILNKLKIDRDRIDTKDLQCLTKLISALVSKRNEKFKKEKKSKDLFIEKHKEWINSIFVVPDLRTNNSPIVSSTLKRGRPSVEFSEMSDRSKRRVIGEISNQCKNDPLKILMAARYAANKSHDTELSSVLKELISNPQSCVQIKQLIKAPQSFKVKTPEEALAFLFDNKLSKSVYTNIHLETKACGSDVWPSYDRVKETKRLCRPPREAIQINESGADCQLQSLLHHTATRIIDLQHEVILAHTQKSNCRDIETVFIFSWGFDGTSGFSSFKQSYSDASTEISDTNLFACTCIPLRLVTTNGIILWNNAISQSEKFCRPIALKWIKETTETIKLQKQLIDEQIEKLEYLEIEKSEYKIRIHFSLHMTLIDGKVLNAITETKSSQTCPICHATPKQFNDLENILKDVFWPITNSLQHGISALHAWIKAMECCLNISYRKNINKWRVTSATDKIEYSRRKAEIQDILWKKLGLKVDMPKAGGCGTSNDGNTARRAFQNPEVFANCLGLNLELVRNLSTILIALSSHLPINPHKFEVLCHQTAKIYIQYYKWYLMPATLHKILIHGKAIIENSILPVGMFAEEASEARNKSYKSFRERNSRKCSRKATMEDIFFRSMDSSDPLIASLSLSSRLQKRKKLPLPSAVIELLALPEIPKENISDVTNKEFDQTRNDDKDDDDEYDNPEMERFYGNLENLELLRED